MRTEDLWAVAYSGPHGARAPGRQRVADVLETARCLAAPARTVVVVQAAERPWWSVLATAFPPGNVLAEPFDRGSGTGVVAALLVVASRAPAARVAVVYGPMSARMIASVDETLADDDDAGAAVTFAHPGGLGRPWPLVIARAQAWLQKIEAIDRSRTSALRTALEHAPHPSDALARIYPFLDNLDLEGDLLAAERSPRVIRLPGRTSALSWAATGSAADSLHP